MHPAPVIALVIRVDAADAPAMQHQRGFNRVQGLARHQQVNIAEQAPAGCPLAAHGIGGTLQQHDRHAQRPQRFFQVTAFPFDRLLLMRSKPRRRQQMPRNLWRQPLQQLLFDRDFGQAADQIGAARQPQQPVPLPQAQARPGPGLAQQAGQRKLIRHARPPANRKLRSHHRAGCTRNHGNRIAAPAGPPHRNRAHRGCCS